MITIREDSEGIFFQVKVQPRARKNAITGELGDAFKLVLTAPPIEGRANEACVGFFADFLKVPHASITIAAGTRSRLKSIRIAGITAEYLRERLAQP